MRRPRWSSWLLGAAAFALVVFGTRGASAYEHDFHVGAKGGLAFQNDRDLGWAVGAHGAYGLSDMFDAELELFASQNVVVDDQKTTVFAATTGLAYKIDILRWIPYVGVLGGYYHWGGLPGPNGETNAVGAAAQLGLDFLMTRDVALSLDFRWHFSFKDEFYSPMRSLMLGAEYRWGY